MKKETVSKNCERVQAELPDWIEEYVLYLKNSASDLTRLNYLNDVKLFLQEHYNTTDVLPADINKLTALDINRYLSNMEVSAATKSRKKSALTSFLNLLYKRRIINNNITLDIDQIKVAKKKSIEKLENGEVGKLLKAVEKESGQFKNRNLLVFNLFLTYGLRLSEVANLTINIFDLDNEVFTIKRKRNKIVEMPITEDIKVLIKNYIDEERKPVNYDALFLSKNNTPLSERGIHDIVTRFTLKVGKEVSPHKLRATAATQMIAQGHSIYDVMDILDHEDVKTTQVYADHVKENKKKVLNNFKTHI